jgi:two-component system, response regulator
MMHALPGHVLVVEDSDEDYATVMDAAHAILIPHRIRRAVSADDCMSQLLHGEPAHVGPALVLLDLNLPHGDGREALNLIKKDLRLSRLPTVVLSTSTSPRDVEYCYTNGANAYHLKPVSHPAHLQVLQDIFRYWLVCAALPEIECPGR